jgi:N-acetylglutamate synthase-like GNAT family acetyltransferase
MRDFLLGGLLKIIPYEDAYKTPLRQLTLEWLEKYVSVEPEDALFLNDPDKYVSSRDGAIYLARYDGDIVGTVALYKLSERNYELAKLAVTERCKGKRIGCALIEHGIETCRRWGADTITLFTTKRLEAAYRLYLKYGFREVPDGKQKYIESDTQMILKI